MQADPAFGDGGGPAPLRNASPGDLAATSDIVSHGPQARRTASSGVLVGAALLALDAACVAGALASAARLWRVVSPEVPAARDLTMSALWGVNPWMPPAALALAAWLILLARAGLYAPAKMVDSVQIARAVTKSALILAGLLLAWNFVFAERLVSRALVGGFVGLGWGALLTGRLLAFRAILRLPRPPSADRAVIVGTTTDAAALAARIRRDARHVCTIVGHLRTSTSGSEPEAIAHDEILGTLDALRALTNRHDLRTVVLATGALSRGDSLRLAVEAERLGLRVLQAPYGWGVVSPRIGVARVGGVDLVDLGGVRYGSWAERAKRVFDVVAVLTGGVFLVPLLLALAVAVRGQDGGPALYTCRRIGRGGRAFDFYKFRSMVVDADAHRDALAAQNEADGRLFKLRADPRVTHLGAWLRRTSLDELPQLWNVLRGDMHLVGPRPLPERDLDGIEDDAEMRYWFELRHRVNPGITGLWQVSGRSDTGFAEMVRHDLRYIEDWSFWLDLQVLAKTVPAVLRGRGAR